ncbi:MAG: bifunctional 5,10-methylenetetrahydrofolate dehydrogenase/5,10-methenyltetrahydrofolate cyclohydrolase [Bacteroidia bacterium]|nr:bifunctional 5,10-methylenetetrahydrofolate dehydrogenase/5,10-methenyltetrahydrofolate cyclohydrolase [Bacteroidia bacterium]
MQILDGKQVASDIRQEIKTAVAAYAAQGHRVPCLAAVLVGNDPASHTYVRNKIAACEEIGYTSRHILMPDDSTAAAVMAVIQGLNEDPAVDGMILQLPLPAHIDPTPIMLAIRPEKDVDGFHPHNVGMMTLNYEPCLLPATPAGIIELIARYGIDTRGKHCVVIGRSRIVGRPISILMSRMGMPGEATVTICHRYTPDAHLRALCREADILIAAVGKPGMVTADMIKPGAVVIDVGTTRVEAPETRSGFRLKGDVVFETVAPLTSYITPVPGGVGPMTIAMLLKNTLTTYQHTWLAARQP